MQASSYLSIFASIYSKIYQYNNEENRINAGNGIAIS